MADKLVFEGEEAEYLKNIGRYYATTKELLIFGEQVDPENRTLPQVINELRNCLDHLMRVVLFKFGLSRRDKDGDYVKTNLDKAYGHVYRAAYDALDWISLTLKGRIIDELQGFSLDTIQAVLPEYFKEIKPRFEEIITNEVTILRMEKDVAQKSEENLVKYGQVVAELKRLFNLIINKKSALVEYQTRQVKSQRKQLIQSIIVKIIIGVVSGVVVGLVVWHLTH